jgi:hypothetical protein
MFSLEARPDAVVLPGPRGLPVVQRVGLLDRLVDELLQPGPVDPAGVAQVRLLLSDGGGPLYNPRSDDDLKAAAKAAIYALML